jgi:hypothetical protein
MKAPTFLNVTLSLLSKYAVFFFILAFKDNRFKGMVIDVSESGRDLAANSFYYVVYVLIHMVIFSLPLSVFMYFSFKMRNFIVFILLIILLITLEYFYYVYLTSQKHIDTDGIWNGVLSVIFLMLFFYRYIGSLFTKQ